MNKQLYIKDGVISDCAIIELEGRWISNPTVEMIHAAGWVEYTPEPHVRTLEEAIEEKIAEINTYDTSTAVNEVFIGGNSLWIDRETRAVLVNRLAAEKFNGKTTTTLWDNQGRSYTMPIAVAEQMLMAIELYAAETYDVTARHKAEVMLMTTIEDADAYDVTQGYPDKPHFEI